VRCSWRFQVAASPKFARASLMTVPLIDSWIISPAARQGMRVRVGQRVLATQPTYLSAEVFLEDPDAVIAFAIKDAHIDPNDVW